MNRYSIYVSAAVVAVASVSCSEKAKMELETYTVEPTSMSEVVTATGTMESVTSVDVGTQVTGIIQNLYADYNDTVKKGQLLAELEKTLLDSELRSADANMASAMQAMNMPRKTTSVIRRSTTNSSFPIMNFKPHNATTMWHVFHTKRVRPTVCVLPRI